MAQEFVSGKEGSVLVGTVAYGYKEWQLSIDVKMLETSSFVAGEYRTYIGGLIGGTLTFSGGLDVGPSGSGGNMPLVAGNSYTFTLKVNSTVSWVVVALVNKADVKDNIDDMATINVNATVTGSFSSQVS